MNYENYIAQCHQLKVELDAYRPLSPDILLQLKQYYRIALTYSSNALEGNTLSESETKVVLEDGITIGGKPLRDHLEALGHAKAYDYLYQLLEKTSISEADILHLHQIVVEGVEEALPGQYRPRPVIITGTEFIPPKSDALPQLMKDFVSKKMAAWDVLDPIEQSALIHLELVTIHPFLDGNGRTARLLMNLFLLRHGYSITIIPPVLRNDYIATLRLAQEKNETQPFINFISHQVYESTKDALRIIRALQP